MRLRINGKMQTLPHGATIAVLLECLGIKPSRIAIELNRAVISRAEHATVRLAEGDEVEIVRAVGGG